MDLQVRQTVRLLRTRGITGESWECTKRNFRASVASSYPLDPDVVHEPVVVKKTVTRSALDTGPTMQDSVEMGNVVFSYSDLVVVKDLLMEEVGTPKAWRYLPLQNIARAIHEDVFHVEANTAGVAPAPDPAGSTVCGFCGGSGWWTTINDSPGKAASLMHLICPCAPRRDPRHEAVALSL
ncbi:unnamed protein product [Sphacelaria rigidula]